MGALPFVLASVVPCGIRDKIMGFLSGFDHSVSQLIKLNFALSISSRNAVPVGSGRTALWIHGQKVIPSFTTPDFPTSLAKLLVGFSTLGSCNKHLKVI